MSQKVQCPGCKKEFIGITNHTRKCRLLKTMEIHDRNKHEEEMLRLHVEQTRLYVDAEKYKSEQTHAPQNITNNIQNIITFNTKIDSRVVNFVQQRNQHNMRYKNTISDTNSVSKYTSAGKNQRNLMIKNCRAQEPRWAENQDQKSMVVC